MRILITTILVLTAISIGISTTHRVPQDFATIQSAINTAVTKDTVLVEEGTYFENLFINKGITLVSRFAVDGDKGHIERTIIDGSQSVISDSASVIVIGPLSDTNCVVQGFTLQRGKGTKLNTYWRCGGGIYMIPRGGHILNNRIINNTLTGTSVMPNVFGGGICIGDENSASPLPWVIEDNIIAHNIIIGDYAEDAGISATGNGAIRGNIVMNNSSEHNPLLGTGVVYGGGVTVRLNASVLVENNYIAGNSTLHNGSGLYLHAYNGRIPIAQLRNNIICGNTVTGNTIGGTVFIRSGVYEFVNNTIADNSGGTVFRIFDNLGELAIRLMNNISYNPQIPDNNEISYAATTAILKVFAGYNHTKSNLSIPTNISGNPSFAAGDSLYRLQSSSTAICGGIHSTTLGTIVLVAPAADYLGNVRPQPAGTRCDMGAIEHDSGAVIDPNGVEELMAAEVPSMFVLEQNYPNPFNPSTSIRYALQMSSIVKLIIYDMLGREIETLVDEEQTAGWKHVQWNASAFSSGMYLARMTAGSFVTTKKILLMK